MTRHVLVVDDDLLLRGTLRDVLEEEGFQVTVARDARSALAISADAGSLLAIVLDLMMPDMSGWEFLALARETAHLRDVPVVVMSGVGDRDRIPPDVPFVPKPIEIDTLLRALRDCERRRAARVPAPAAG
jgi:CheY-like chemotaxis protein